MKFYALADLHLGRTLFGRSLIEDQIDVLNQIKQKIKEENPQALLLAGDIYDKPIPSQEAVGLFNDFLTSLKVENPTLEILIIAGNHDSSKRLEFASELLKTNQIHIAGSLPQDENEYLNKVTLQDEFGPVHFYLLPYLRSALVRPVFQDELKSSFDAVKKMIEREKINTKERNVLLSHQFYTFNGKEPLQSDSEVMNLGGLDNVDIEAVNDFDYVALGHVHGPQKIGKETIRYAGSLLKYSLSEANHHKSMVSVTMKEKGNVEVELIPLTPLHDVRKIVGSLNEVNQKNLKSEDYVSITLTDKSELYEAKEKLIEIFPNLLEIQLDNSTLQKMLEENEEKIVLATPEEAFSEFYRQTYNEQMSQEEEALMIEIFNEVKKEEFK